MRAHALVCLRMCVVLQVLQVLGRMCVVLQVLSRSVVLQVLGHMCVVLQVLGLVLQVLGLGLGGAFTAHRCLATHQILFSPNPGNLGASE